MKLPPHQSLTTAVVIAEGHARTLFGTRQASQKRSFNEFSPPAQLSPRGPEHVRRGLSRRGGTNRIKYGKAKPWDDPTIDHWAIPSWVESMKFSQQAVQNRLPAKPREVAWEQDEGRHEAQLQ